MPDQKLFMLVEINSVRPFYNAASNPLPEIHAKKEKILILLLSRELPTCPLWNQTRLILFGFA
jgi:hypothetical protein